MKFFGKLLVVSAFALILTACADAPIHVSSTTVVYNNQPPRSAYQQRSVYPGQSLQPGEYYATGQYVVQRPPQYVAQHAQYEQSMPPTVTQTTAVIWFGASAGTSGPRPQQPRRWSVSKITNNKAKRDFSRSHAFSMLK